MFKKINRLKKHLILNGIKRVVTSGQDYTQLNFRFEKKELKNGLGPGMMHVFNPKTQETKDVDPRVQEQIRGQSSLGNEGNDQKDVIK